MTLITTKRLYNHQQDTFTGHIFILLVGRYENGVKGYPDRVYPLPLFSFLALAYSTHPPKTGFKILSCERCSLHSLGSVNQ